MLELESKLTIPMACYPCPSKLVPGGTHLFSFGIGELLDSANADLDHRQPDVSNKTRRAYEAVVTRYLSFFYHFAVYMR